LANPRMGRTGGAWGEGHHASPPDSPLRTLLRQWRARTRPEDIGLVRRPRQTSAAGSDAGSAVRSEDRPLTAREGTAAVAY
jgi:hypothetical protein